MTQLSIYRSIPHFFITQLPCLTSMAIAVGTLSLAIIGTSFTAYAKPGARTLSSRQASLLGLGSKTQTLTKPFESLPYKSRFSVIALFLPNFCSYSLDIIS